MFLNLHRNKNTNYLLTCIDIASRFAWIEPLKNKTALTVSKALSKILDSIYEKFSKYPRIIASDNGSEFKNTEMTKLLSSKKIIQTFGKAYHSNSQGFIEGFNAYVRRLILVYTTEHGTKDYFLVLQDLVSNYNNSKHSSLNTFPSILINKAKIDNFVKAKVEKVSAKKTSDRLFPILKIGDKVRIARIFYDNQFAKLRKQNQGKNQLLWSKETYKITKVLNKGKRFYKLDGLKNLFLKIEFKKFLKI